MSQSESPADKLMATTAVAAGGASFTVLLNIGDYLGSNFETIMLIASNKILFNDVYTVKVLVASVFFIFFAFAFIVCAYLWKMALDNMRKTWNEDRDELASDKVKQETKERRNRRLIFAAALRVNRTLKKLEKFADKYLVDDSDS